MAPNQSTPGRVAGIDLGTVRIGIAVSDPGRTIASPLETYQRHDTIQDGEHFQQLVAKEEITLFVVGLPVHLDGRESEQSQAARQFGRWLKDLTGVPVVFFDERFTTREAEEALEAAKLSSKRRKRRRDRVAAQFLLAAFLESGSKQHDLPGPLDD